MTIEISQPEEFPQMLRGPKGYIIPTKTGIIEIRDAEAGNWAEAYFSAKAILQKESLIPNIDFMVRQTRETIIIKWGSDERVYEEAKIGYAIRALYRLMAGALRGRVKGGYTRHDESEYLIHWNSKGQLFNAYKKIAKNKILRKTFSVREYGSIKDAREAARQWRHSV